MQHATHRANPVSVVAATILEVTEQDNGNLMLRLSDGRNYEADTRMTVRYRPVAGDYLVTQVDGYEYLNPKVVFEHKYAPVVAAPTSDASIEQEIQAKGLTAPRVTPGDLTANIVDTEFVTHVAKSGQVLRWAVLTTRSGFAVVGKPSVSVSPENDDEKIGRQVAYDYSRSELWPLMGYALKERLASA